MFMFHLNFFNPCNFSVSLQGFHITPFNPVFIPPVSQYLNSASFNVCIVKYNLLKEMPQLGVMFTMIGELSITTAFKLHWVTHSKFNIE